MALHLEGQVNDLHKITPQEFNVLQINSIGHIHKEKRQKSKAPTFALT